MLDNVTKTIELAKKSQSDFLKIELELSEAFLHRALSTHDDETRERNLQHARAGYETLLRVMQRSEIDSAEREQMLNRMQSLRSELEKFEAL